jgi:hypothetical protein
MRVITICAGDFVGSFDGMTPGSYFSGAIQGHESLGANDD